jgi:hypothetical protein
VKAREKHIYISGKEKDTIFSHANMFLSNFRRHFVICFFYGPTVHRGELLLSINVKKEKKECKN